jgi:DNA-binding NarL/FixJ family response regulator
LLIRVFLYDDNPPLRESISSLLQLQDKHELMLTKEHANEILEDLKGTRPELILMEIEMPVQSGI